MKTYNRCNVRKSANLLWESVCIQVHNSYMLFGLYYERILLFTMTIYDIRDPWTWVGRRNQISLTYQLSAHIRWRLTLYTPEVGTLVTRHYRCL